MFDRHLTLWHLTPDGLPIITRSARLLPVCCDGKAAMLKIAVESEEKFGGVLMDWWGGDGAARVLAMEGDAILLERAQGKRSLSEFARSGRDDEATAIICDVIAALHSPRGKRIPELIPLHIWFQELNSAATAHGGILARSAEVARRLLEDPQDMTVLHGDIHHDNILDFEDRGWLAIDPKRIKGERGFDYANLFCNPDVGDTSCHIARQPRRFERRMEIVSERARIDRHRLLQWIIAWTGLSAAWFIGDGQNPEVDFCIAELALAAIES